MAAPAIIFSPHRSNKDGPFDSICAKCFATVAFAQTDAALAAYDRKHICDPTVLFDQANSRLHLKAQLRLKSS